MSGSVWDRIIFWVAGVIGLLGLLAIAYNVVAFFRSDPPTPQEPVSIAQEQPKGQLLRITEGVDERGNDMRVSEYGVLECERCRRLFEEAEG